MSGPFVFSSYAVAPKIRPPITISRTATPTCLASQPGARNSQLPDMLLLWVLFVACDVLGYIRCPSHKGRVRATVAFPYLKATAATHGLVGMRPELTLPNVPGRRYRLS